VCGLKINGLKSDSNRLRKCNYYITIVFVCAILCAVFIYKCHIYDIIYDVLKLGQWN